MRNTIKLLMGYRHVTRTGSGRLWLTSIYHRHMTSGTTTKENAEFDEKLLKVLVCPLTKKPLRYDKERNELISDTIQVAYPIVNGKPNLVPQDGRMMNVNEDNKT